MPAAFTHINRTGSLTEEVAARIKESILNTDYRPGESLPNENQMAEQFGVSRIVIREALKDLKSKGLIEIRRGSKGGSFVTQPDRLTLGEQFSDMIRLRQMTVKHLFEARLHIEPEVVRLVIKNATQEQIVDLRKYVALADSELDPIKRRDMNADFHRRLGHLSANPYYALLMDSFIDFSIRFLVVINPRTDNLHDERVHARIAEAISDRDEMKALTLVRSHLLDVRDKMMAKEQFFLGARPNGNHNPPVTGGSKSAL